MAAMAGYWVYWTLHPSYWFNGDPAAYYMLDSLSVFAGGSYTYVDHPGTPIHVIGSLMLALIRPFFSNTESFIHFFINKPVAFFIMAHVFLLTAFIFTAAVFFNTAYYSLKNFRLAGAIALPLMYLVLHPQSFQALTLWSHNSLNYPLGTLWLLWLYNELRKGTTLGQNRILLLGLAGGILATTHIYYITWIACGMIAVFLYSAHSSQSLKIGWFKGLIFSLASLAGIVSMLVPVYKELPRFAKWLLGITTHTSMYGIGEVGIFSLETILIAIRFWWTSTPLMMSLLTTVIIAIFWLARQARKTGFKIPPASRAMIIGLLIQIGLLLILFTKAAVKLRYTLALASVLPVLLLVAINLFEMINPKNANRAGTIYLIILIAMGIIFPQQIKFTQGRFYYEEEVVVAETEVIENLSQALGIPEQKVRVVFAYGTPLKCANMLIASDYTGHFKDEISAMCPSQYGIYDTHIQLNPVQPLNDIHEIEWDLVVWPGNGSDLPQYLEAVGAVNVPVSWRIQRDKWYFIHPDVVQ